MESMKTIWDLQATTKQMLPKNNRKFKSLSEGKNNNQSETSLHKPTHYDQRRLSHDYLYVGHRSVLYNAKFVRLTRITVLLIMSWRHIIDIIYEFI